MDQEQQNTVLSFKEIGNIFSDIDRKILLLHQCSYDDFVVFNTQLKNFNSQLHNIADNLRKILLLNTTSNGGKSQFESLIDNFLESVDNIRLNYELIIKEIERYKKNINSLSVSIRNYKQNLLTYKYLLSNLNIRLIYLNPENLSFDDVPLINDQITILNDFSAKLKKNKDFLSELSMGLYSVIKNNSEVLQFIIRDLRDIWYKKEAYFNDIEICANGMAAKISAASSDLGQIITHLQFQDIVRQRMEHIQQMHKEVIDATEMFDDTEFNLLPGIRQARYIIQLRDIAVLQMGQLTQVNLQYQNAIEVITRTFVNIVENITDATLIYVVNFVNGDKKNIFNDQKLLQILQDTSSRYKQIQSDVLLSFKELDQVNEICDSYSENFSVIKTNHENLIEFSLRLIEAIEKTELTADEKQNIIGHIQQLIINNRIFDDFDIFLKQNSEIKSNFVKCSKRLSEFSKGEHPDSTTQQIILILEEILENSKKINEIYETNDKISNTLIENVFDAMQQVKYYDLFEKSVEEIVGQLNLIYEQIIGNNKRKVRPEVIDYFKELYTMEHERRVHSQVASGKIFPDIGNQLKDNQSENDVELF